MTGDAAHRFELAVMLVAENHRSELRVSVITPLSGGIVSVMVALAGITTNNSSAIQRSQSLKLKLEIVTNTEFHLVVVGLFTPLGELVTNRYGQPKPQRQLVDAHVVQFGRNRVAVIVEIV